LKSLFNNFAQIDSTEKVDSKVQIESHSTPVSHYSNGGYKADPFLNSHQKQPAYLSSNPTMINTSLLSSPKLANLQYSPHLNSIGLINSNKKPHFSNLNPEMHPTSNMPLIRQRLDNHQFSLGGSEFGLENLFFSQGDSSFQKRKLSQEMAIRQDELYNGNSNKKGSIYEFVDGEDAQISLSEFNLAMMLDTKQEDRT